MGRTEGGIRDWAFKIGVKFEKIMGKWEQTGAAGCKSVRGRAAGALLGLSDIPQYPATSVGI